MNRLVLSTLFFPPGELHRLRALSPLIDVEQHTAERAEDVPEALWARVEVLYTGFALPHPDRAPRLRWVQLDTAGIDQILDTPLWHSPVRITTLAGIAPPGTAEHVLMMMLALSHHLPQILDHQARMDWPSPMERWQRFMPRELYGATAGIIGYGNIGSQVGALCHALGMRVLALRRGGGSTSRASAFTLPGLAGAAWQPELFFGPDGRDALLAQSDYVILAAPSTPETYHLIDQSALTQMKPSAILINVGRGSLIDEAALVDALRAGRFGGAALDVFEQEPLPPDSPLWTMPNVIVSPHVAGYTPHYNERVIDLFAQNLRRYLAGRPLLNLVDRARGY